MKYKEYTGIDLESDDDIRNEIHRCIAEVQKTPAEQAADTELQQVKRQKAELKRKELLLRANKKTEQAFQARQKAAQAATKQD